jgi:catechol 2,3-dioxygenase-like lactoylglutathione lyase family enzyme
MHVPEAVALPVRNVARAVGFYRERAGFELEHESIDAGGWMAILAPPGPGSAIVVGDLPELRELEPGSLRGLRYTVADVARTREEMLARGVLCGSLTAFREGGGGTLFGFADPDGNTWAVQEAASVPARPGR